MTENELKAQVEYLTAQRNAQNSRIIKLEEEVSELKYNYAIVADIALNAAGQQMITVGQVTALTGAHPKAVERAIEEKLLKGLPLYGSLRFLQSHVVSVRPQLLELQDRMHDEIWPPR